MPTIQIGFDEFLRTYECSDETAEFCEGKKGAFFAETKAEILALAKDFYAKYQKGVADKDNFYLRTIAEFKLTKRPRRKPDFVSISKRDGKTSSEYWYTEEGVIRGSKHWGRGIASCDWYLEGQGTDMNGRKQYGLCKWEDFTQKTELRTNEFNMTADISTFENTTGDFAKMIEEWEARF